MSGRKPKMVRNSNGGEIGRRQLIQVLGAAAGSALVGAVVPGTASATSAPAVKAAAPATPSHGRFQAVCYNHISYCVPDVAKDRDFWIQVMGMEDIWDDGKQCAVQFGNPPSQIIVRPIDPAYERKLGFAPPRGPWAHQMGRGFVDHYAFSIPNYNNDEVMDELKHRGLNPTQDGPFAVNIKDPSGWLVQIAAIKGGYPGQALKGWKYENGIKNLASVPKPTNAPFKAYAFSHCVRRVSNVEACRDFYMDLLGMNLLYWKPGNLPHIDKKGGPVCFLTFGPNNENCLYFRQSEAPGGIPYVDHFSAAVSNYNQEAVLAKLMSMGYHPKPDSKYAWEIHDPAGMRTEVAGAGVPEHIAGDCNGDIYGCPGGIDQ